MSRGADRKDKKRLARAADELRKGLLRRDGELILSALATLGEDAAAEDVARASAIVLAEIATCHRGRQWPRLASFGAKIERDGGRLLGDLTGPRWSIFWGLALSGDWAQARRTWTTLEAETSRRDPDLALAVAAWLEGAGDPNGEVFAKFEAVAARFIDPKLGVEGAPLASRTRPEPPTDIEGVPTALCAAFGNLPFKEFRTTVEGWLSKAHSSSELQGAMATAACELSFLEVLRRQGTERDAPLALFAHCASAGGASIDRILHAIRLVIGDTAGANADISNAAASLVRLAVASATSRETIIGALVAIDLPDERRLALVHAAAEVAADAHLWWTQARLTMKASKRLFDSNVMSSKGVQLLEDGLRRLLAAARGKALADGMRLLDRDRRKVLDMIFSLVDGALVAELCLALWDSLDAPGRRDVAGAVATRFDCASAGYCDHCTQWHSSRPLALSSSDRQLWSRVGHQVAPYDFDLLAWWSEDQPVDAVTKAILAFVDDDGDLAHYLVALELATRRAPRSVDEIVSRLIDRFSGDLGALAFVIVSPELKLTRGARTRLEQVFVTAARSQPGVRTPVVLRALKRIETAEKRRRRRRTRGQTLCLPGMDPTETMGATRGAVK